MVRVAVVVAVLTIAAWTPRSDGQCTLSSPVRFDPSTVGSIARPTRFGDGGFANGLDLYQVNGTKRLIVMENYGYGTYDASNPSLPFPIAYQDMSATVPQQGDGQSIIIALAAAGDGSRALVNWKQSPHGTFLMKAIATNGFDFAGDFPGFRATGGVVADQVGTRYLGYALNGTNLYVADVSSFLSGQSSITANSIPSETVMASTASAGSLHRAGHFIVFSLGTTVGVVDGSNPGPAGRIVSGLTTYTIPNVAFGLGPGDKIASVSAAIHPSNGKLYIMAVGSSSGRPTGIGLVSTSLASINFTAVGAAFHAPAPYDATSGLTTFAGTAIPTGDDIFFQTLLQGSSGTYRLVTLSANGWGSELSPSAIVDPSTATYFTTPQQMRGFATANKVYSYVAAQSGAYVLPLTCTASNSPAIPDLQVDIDNGDGTFKPLSSGDTAFIGDKLRITSSVSPNPSSIALSGWRFDYDFHASEDNGSGFPRLRTPDLSDTGGAPPTTLTLVGPCDPGASGDPSTGNGCWSSILGNGATGGPDFTDAPAAGTQKLLNLTLEAQNSFGSGFKSFGINWKVPAAKLKSTSVLLGGSLQSGSEGHPLAAGYKWYFGADSNAPGGEVLNQDTACTGATCAHVFPAKGTYNYWLSAPYAGGFSSADCASPCTTSLGTVSVTDVVLGFSVPTTALTSNASIPVANQSTIAQSVTPCNGGYEYSICDAGSGSCAEGAYSPLSFSGTTAQIPISSNATTYWLRIRYNYSTGGGCSVPLTAQWSPNVANDPTAWPVLVSNVVPVIKILVNNVDPCPPGPGGSGCDNPLPVNVNDTLTALAYVNGIQDANPPSGLAWNFGARSSPSSGNGQGVTFKYTSAGTSTVTMTGYGASITTIIQAATPPPPTTHLSIGGVNASPNPVALGSSTTLSASLSNINGALVYSWNFGDGSPLSTSAAPSHTYAAAGNYTARLTVHDSADTVSGAVTVQVTSGPPPPANPIDFTVNDTATGARILYQAPFGYAATSGQSLTFISINASGTITWNFGDGATASGSTAVHTYVSSVDASYTIKLTANSQIKQYGIDIAGTLGALTAAYTATYSDGTSINRSSVTAAKAIRFTASDDADAYDWDFGDQSAHGSGKTVLHSFTTAGTFTVKVTVTKTGVGSATTPSPLSYSVPTPPAPTLWLVAGMAYTDGLGGTFWQSDLSVFNPDATRGMLISLAFLSGQTSITDASQLQWSQVFIDRQSTKSFKNVLSNPPFGLAKGSFGAILIRGDDVPSSPVITGRTFNNGGASGTYGLSVPAVPVSAGVRTQSPSAGNILIGLRELPGEFHMNFALANLAGDYATAQVQFFDTSGLQLGTTIRVDLAPYGVHQINRALSSKPSDGGAGFTTPPDGSFAAVVSLQSGTSVFPYATVINEHTGDPIVITPPTRPSTSYRIPGIVRAHGKNNTLFKSDLTLFNSSTSQRRVNVRYWYQSSRAGVTSGVQTYAKELTLQARQSIDFRDFVKSWLPAGSDLDTTEYFNSYVDVTPAGGDTSTEALLVLGQTYNDQPGGSVGFQVPGYTVDDGVTASGTNRRLTMTGLSSGTSYRTNVALFLDQQSINLYAGATIKVVDASGAVVKSIPVALSDASGSFTQVNDDTLFAGLTGDISSMTVIVDGITGNAPIASYATVIDNTSGDAILIPGQPTP
jgi:PKD repeat protein